MSRPAQGRWVPAAVGLFELLFRPWMRRRLEGVRLTGLPAELPADRPLILVANHASWWDGFVLRELQRTLRPGAPLYTLMSGEELRRLPFFRLMGALDVGPRSPRALLGALRRLLSERRRRSDVVVAIFPQGRLWPAHRRPLGFERGVSAVARLLAPAIVLPVGIDYQLFASPAPTAFVSVGEPLLARHGLPREQVEQAVTQELDRISAFLAAHGERAARAWPGLLGRLPDAPPSRAHRDLLHAVARLAIEDLDASDVLPTSRRRVRRPGWPRGLTDA